MQRIRRRWPVVVAGLFVSSFVVYQIPWVNLRVNWQLDVAQTIILSRLNPAGKLPPPEILPQPEVVTTGAELPSSADPTVQPPVPTLQPTSVPIPKAVQLSPAEYEAQGPNNCGPATLSMYLRYYGWQGDQYDISAEIKPVNGDRNVNVDELVYYASNWAGWLQTKYRVGGTVDLIKQLIAAGIPVLVEKGHLIKVDYFPEDDYWNGHYALVTGYDENADEFTFQDSYNGADQRMSFAEFDEWWQQFNRVYILAYLPEQEDQVKELVGADWDEEANRQNALATSQAEVQVDPENAYAWFNLGMNQVYFGQYGPAAASFDEARRIGLPMRMLRYQFGPFWAYYHTDRMEDLATMIDYALQITPNSEDVLLWKGWAFYKEGDVNAAIEQFRLAWENNPNSAYVAQALYFMGANP